MGNFQLYFEIGFKHIVNIGALDHILFMAAIALMYQFVDFKKLLIIVTAFTLGHAVTLALAIFHVIYLPKNWIEFLIAITIIITSFSNLFVKMYLLKTKPLLRY